MVYLATPSAYLDTRLKCQPCYHLFSAVYVVPKGEKMSRVNQVWTSEQLSVTGDFQHVTIKLNRRSLTSRHVSKTPL